jgi:hypothetical protein
MRKFIPLSIASLLLLPATSYPDTVTAQRADDLHRYSASCSVTAAGAVAKCAISVPSTGTKRIFLDYVVVRSTVATDVVFERGGSAPTTTAVSAVKLNTTASPQATVYHTANSGVGTSTVTRKITTADADFAFGLDGEVFAKATETTLVVKSASMTGTFVVDFFWGEGQK